MILRTAPWLWTTVGIGVALTAIFLVWPGIDLAAARLFYLGGNDFLIRNTGVAWFVAEVLRPGFTIGSIGLGLFILWRLAVDRPRRWARLRKLVFVAACLAIGPGLVANAVLKENWGRARPKQVVEFDGERRFTPPLVIADQCSRNCSFVSGDASFAFALLSVALLASRRRRHCVAAALTFGLVVGALRMMNGSHFLSDVLFAGTFVALVTLTLYRWMIEGRLAEDWRLVKRMGKGPVPGGTGP